MPHLLVVTAAVAEEPWRESVLACGVDSTVDSAGGGWHHLTAASAGAGPE